MGAAPYGLVNAPMQIGVAAVCWFWSARDGLSANDPKRTMAKLMSHPFSRVN